MFLAFFSQASAAASTLIFLVVIRGRDWSSEFLHIYTWCALLTGGLNTAIYFGVFKWPLLRAWYFPIIVLIVTVITAFLGTCITLGDFSLDIPKLFLISGLVAPILIAPKFGILFGNFRKLEVFRLNIFLNVVLVVGVLISTFITEGRDDFYFWSGLLPFLSLAIISYFTDVSCVEERIGSLQQHNLVTILNPALPVLERAVWDQWILKNFGLTDWAWWIYLSSKLVTFFGGMFFTLLTANALEASSNKQFKNEKILVVGIVSLAFVLVLMGAYFQPAAFLCSTFFSWTLGAFLLRFSNKIQKNKYQIVLFLWGFDFIARMLLWALGIKVDTYVLFLLIAYFPSILFLFVFALKQPARLP